MNIFSKEELNEFCNSNLSYKEKIDALKEQKNELNKYINLLDETIENLENASLPERLEAKKQWYLNEARKAKLFIEYGGMGTLGTLVFTQPACTNAYVNNDLSVAFVVYIGCLILTVSMFLAGINGKKIYERELKKFD